MIVDPAEVRRLAHEELALVQQRGVRLDPARWSAAVDSYRPEIAAVPYEPMGRWCRRAQFERYAGLVLERALGDPLHRVRATWTEPGCGRIMAKEPPLQAITKKDGGGLRRSFIPAEGHYFIAGDWSLAQVRVAAGKSGDAELCEHLAPGRDVYQLIGNYAAEVVTGLEDPRSFGKRVVFQAIIGQTS